MRLGWTHPAVRALHPLVLDSVAFEQALNKKCSLSKVVLSEECDVFPTCENILFYFTGPTQRRGTDAVSGEEEVLRRIQVP